jgi:hypothetical protein
LGVDSNPTPAAVSVERSPVNVKQTAKRAANRYSLNMKRRRLDLKSSAV